MTFLYAPTLSDPFHGDDFVAFTEFKTKGFFEYSRDVFLFKDTNFYWRPLGSILHYSLYGLFGLDASAFRVVGLVFFLATLVCIYLFCVGERLSKWAAVGAALLFGVMPSHVVSVSWVTNTSRLMAALFLLVSVLMLQKTRTSRHAWLWEAAAYFSFVVAVLSDEVTAALVAVPIMFGAFLLRDDFKLWPAVGRLVAYGLVVAVVVPLQFIYTMDDEARLSQYGFGEHMLTTVWVVASQLSLPIGEGAPLDIYLHRFPATQWAAGMGTIAALLVLAVVGSRFARFLVVWCLLAILPFSLWQPLNISPRYVYLAALPFAILVAWAAAQLVSAVISLTSGKVVVLRLLRYSTLTTLAVVMSVGLVVSSRTVESRNEAWSEETGRYGLLREALEELPAPPPGSRIVMYYGDDDWTDFWATAVARSVYGDPSLQAVSVPPQRIDVPFASQSNDIVYYLLGERLLPTAVKR